MEPYTEEELATHNERWPCNEKFRRGTAENNGLAPYYEPVYDGPTESERRRLKNPPCPDLNTESDGE